MLRFTTTKEQESAAVYANDGWDFDKIADWVEAGMEIVIKSISCSETNCRNSIWGNPDHRADASALGSKCPRCLLVSEPKDPHK